MPALGVERDRVRVRDTEGVVRIGVERRGGVGDVKIKLSGRERDCGSAEEAVYWEAKLLGRGNLLWNSIITSISGCSSLHRACLRGY